LIEEKLRDLNRRTWSGRISPSACWTRRLQDVVRVRSANELLRFMALLLGEMLVDWARPNDFLATLAATISS